LKKLVYIVCLLPVIFSVGCKRDPKQMNQTVTLWRKDKNPYGTYYAFTNLNYVFPHAEINVNKKSPADFAFYSQASYKGPAGKSGSGIGYIIISPRVIPDDREINALLNFVGSGHQVFISSLYFGDSLLSKLNITMGGSENFFTDEDSLKLSIDDPFMGDSLNFVYPGRRFDNAAARIDSQYANVLGRDRRGRPNFIKFGYKGGGAIFLHFAPLAFSNFFLLHKNNKTYYDLALSYMSPALTEIKWDEYFRYPRSTNFSSLQFIMSNRSLRWAFWLILLLFGIVYLVESKRRQLIIPAKSVLRNSSLDFVKTIGRLYYQRRDNGNIAAKMSTHFFDHVRNKYNISTTVINEDFIDRLSYKSGFDKRELTVLINSTQTISNDPDLEDEALLIFNKQIEEFYKKA